MGIGAARTFSGPRSQKARAVALLKTTFLPERSWPLMALYLRWRMASECPAQLLASVEPKTGRALEQKEWRKQFAGHRMPAASTTRSRRPRNPFQFIQAEPAAAWDLSSQALAAGCKVITLRLAVLDFAAS